jgi:predicted hotdog family 3-hydroxylacyl-ACP dehydratase
MRLVDEVIDVTPRSVTCRSTLRDDHILKNSNGDISALLAIELFAQTAAVLMLHRATLKTDGTKMTRGMLVGVRTLDLEVDAFDVGDVLSTRMEERYTADAIVQLAGEVERDGVVVARGAINVARS